VGSTSSATSRTTRRAGERFSADQARPWFIQVGHLDLDATLVEIAEETVLIRRAGEVERIPAVGPVLVSVGMEPRRDLLDACRDLAPRRHRTAAMTAGDRRVLDGWQPCTPDDRCTAAFAARPVVRSDADPERRRAWECAGG
jgi:hypothetical protein